MSGYEATESLSQIGQARFPTSKLLGVALSQVQVIQLHLRQKPYLQYDTTGVYSGEEYVRAVTISLLASVVALCSATLAIAQTTEMKVERLTQGLMDGFHYAYPTGTVECFDAGLAELSQISNGGKWDILERYVQGELILRPPSTEWGVSKPIICTPSGRVSFEDWAPY